MKIRSLGLGFLALTAAFLLSGCVSHNPPPPMANELAVQQPPERPSEPTQLPIRYQSPTFTVKPLTSTDEFGTMKETIVPVGADFTSSTPVPLRDIIKQLAQMKGMNVSWANDVDQTATVDVNIRAEEDFFKSISNLLRQLDYFQEVHGNTLVIMHKAVRKYHIAMPFVASKFSSGIGGDVLGSTGSQSSGNMKGKVELTSDENEFDIWKNIQENLDKVLEIWEAPTPMATPAPGAAAGQPAAKAAPEPSRPPVGKGYYTIDKPIGLITVTAPPSLLDKIDAYINNLKAELYRQVVIEAKIVEVTLNQDNTTGINWEDLLSGAGNSFLRAGIDFQTLSSTYPAYGRFLTLQNKNFNVFMDAIKTQGTTNVIANPKISVMNGQPAMINIGENVTYIDSVTSTENAETRSTTYTVSTGTILSGVVLSVVPTIMEGDQIILSLSPVTSQLQEPIEYKTFGANNQVGLPRVNVREMNTMVRLKDQEMLVVGGLIDNSDTDQSSRIPGLGDIPGIGKLFGTSGKVKQHKELVIFLRPRIVS